MMGPHDCRRLNKGQSNDRLAGAVVCRSHYLLTGPRVDCNVRRPTRCQVNRCCSHNTERRSAAFECVTVVDIFAHISIDTRPGKESALRLCDLITDASIVLELSPEELAAALLRVLNRQADEERKRKVDLEPAFNLGNFCSASAAGYGQYNKEPLVLAVATAWNHLEAIGMLAAHPLNHGWHFLTARAKAVRSEAGYEHLKKIALYPRGSIHPWIEKETYAEFLRGDYETAIFKAFKAIEVVVRELGRRHVDDRVIGKDLMAKAFNPKDGYLSDEREIEAERTSLMELYRGAIGWLKNPASHRVVNITEPVEAIEMIQLASLLMRVVEKRQWDVREPPAPLTSA